MRVAAVTLLATGLYGQSVYPPAVDPDFHYPKSSQVQVIVEGFKLKALRGIVAGPDGAKIAGPVLIELIRGVSDERRVDARFCDEEGAFNFGPMKKGQYYVKISMEGWDTLYFPVKLGSRGRKQLKIELRPSN